MIAVANPLRGLAADAAAVSDVVRTIDGPVVLVGHSYGGSVITNVDAGAGEIAALVYVAGFAPEPGETCAALSTMFPGSTLEDALEAWTRADLTIAQDQFHTQFAAAVNQQDARRMAVTQRPILQQALLPSWFVFGALDRNIPAAVQLYMAGRAEAQRVVELQGASHAISLSHPTAVADVILEAATLQVAA